MKEMFGTLRPHRCSLSADARLQHRHLYCGLCKTMGEDYGQVSRALVSFDAVLVGALVESLRATPSQTDRCRCPINPAVFRPTLSHDSVPMRFAAATQVLLADQWVADKAAEGSRTAQLLRPLGRRTVHRAADILSAMGATPEQIAGLELEQHAVESTGAGPVSAAAPTAQALERVFAWTGRLPGAVDLDPAQHAALGRLGAAVGQAIYGIDALEDLEDDLWSGAFNPCVVDGQLSAARRTDCEQMLSAAFRTIRSSLDAIPWARDAALVRNILLERQHQKARAAVQKARRVQAPPAGRWARLWAMLAAAWAMLVPRAGTPEQADDDEWDEVFDEQERKKKRRKKGGGGGDDGDGGRRRRGLDCDDCLDCMYCGECGCEGCCWRRDSNCCDLDVPGPCDLDCCPCDGDGCGCEPDCCPCDCG